MDERREDAGAGRRGRAFRPSPTALAALACAAVLGPRAGLSAEPPSAQVFLRDGNFIRGTVSFESLRVRTAYGVLTVPSEDLLRVEFAPEPSDGRENLPEDKVFARKFSIVGRAELDELEVSIPQGRLRVPRADLQRLVLQGGAGREPVARVLIVKTWTDPNEEFARTKDIIARRTKLKIAEFTGSSAAELKRALSKHRVLVLPEFERPSPDLEQIASQAGDALREFVHSGGVVVSCGGTANIQFLASSRLLPSQGASSGGGNATVAKRHPIVRGISAQVPEANATMAIRALSPGRVRGLLQNASGEIIVGIAAVGEGAVVYCGWDFFQSAEPHQRILANAVLWAAGRIE